jgi:hypothetical protein
MRLVNLIDSFLIEATIRNEWSRFVGRPVETSEDPNWGSLGGAGEISGGRLSQL